MVMYQNRNPSYNRFDVIDLDPYGSCSIFLDGAVQSLCDGGLLCVTSTDLTVLCGNHPEVVFTTYGANCPKTPFCHELAVRIVLYTIMMNAAKYGRSIEVLGAFQSDFYVRCFVRMYAYSFRIRISHDSKTAIKQCASHSALLYYCNECHHYQLQPLGRSHSDQTGRFEG